ncbi:IniB N-terminal domain-containing protein, partial [Pseudonocardia asaccharolytica]|uniref:IniB N-terminal domain-containing protein n=1 Tax=Pseudonocardia asaccharolytica TaxID=54010 RepID=UPI001C9958CA
MAESISLLDFLLKLIGNDSESIQLRDWFAEDPDAALAHYGLTDLSAEDVHDALVLIEDNQTASFDREFSTGGNHIQLPPPPAPVHHGGDSH